MEEFDCVVIGAGAAGLAAAYNLSKHGKKVLVVEKGKKEGGAAEPLCQRGYCIEKFYHHLFESDSEILSTARELGLLPRIEWTLTKTGFAYGEKILNFSTPIDLALFPEFSWGEKLSFALAMLKIRLAKHSSSLDSVTAGQWLAENAGEGVYKKFFEPLLASKFGDKKESVSAAWLAERLRIRSNRGLQGEKLGYLKGGFHLLFQELRKRCEDNSCQFSFGNQVEKIFLNNRKAVSVAAGGKKVACKAIVSTIQPSALLKVIDFPREYVERISSLEYQGAVCVLAGLKKPLSEFYWTNTVSPKLSFGAIIEHCNLRPPEEYNGERLVYLASYPNYSSDAWKISEKEVANKYLRDLKRIYPHLREEDVLWKKTFRLWAAGLVYKTGILKLLPDCATPVENVFVGGMFNSYPERSIDASLRLGKTCAELAFQKI